MLLLDAVLGFPKFFSEQVGENETKQKEKEAPRVLGDRAVTNRKRQQGERTLYGQQIENKVAHTDQQKEGSLAPRRFFVKQGVSDQHEATGAKECAEDQRGKAEIGGAHKKGGKNDIQFNRRHRKDAEDM